MITHDPHLNSALDAACRQGIAEGALHGLVVVAGHGPVPDVIWSGGCAAVTPTRRAMTDDAVFDIASVTKAVATATACGICIDRGLLDPEAPVRHYLPECAQPPGAELRVRDLATHTSGFANEKFVGLPGEALMQQLLTAPASWPTRDRYHYACRNFVLLGLIVERLVGRTLGEFCHEHIFAPLGMTATAAYPLPERLQNRLVPGITRTGPDLHSMYTRCGRMLGHAGLYAPAADLARFCTMMLAGGSLDGTRILGEKALRWLTEPCSPPGLPARSFGYDMRPAFPADATDRSLSDENPFCSTRPEGLSPRAFGHPGWSGQVMWIDPHLGLYLIVLTNRTHELDIQANRMASARLRAEVGSIVLRHRRDAGWATSRVRSSENAS